MEPLDLMVMAQKRIENLRQEAIIVMGPVKSGKTALCNSMRGHTMISKYVDHSQQILFQTSQQIDNQWQRMSNQQTQALPRVWHTTQICQLIEMQGFLDQRDCLKELVVYYSMFKVIQKVKRVRFILTIEEGVLHSKSPYYAYRIFKKFLDFFVFPTQETRDLFQSIEIVVTQSTKTLTQHLKRIQLIIQQLEREKEIEVEKKHLTIRLLQTIHQNQQISSFNYSQIDRINQKINIEESKCKFSQKTGWFIPKLGQKNSLQITKHREQILQYIDQKLELYKDLFCSLNYLNQDVYSETFYICHQQRLGCVKKIQNIYAQKLQRDEGLLNKIAKIQQRSNKSRYIELQQRNSLRQNQITVGQVILQKFQANRIIEQLNVYYYQHILDADTPFRWDLVEILIVLLQKLVNMYLLLENSQNTAYKLKLLLIDFKNDINILHFLQSNFCRYCCNSIYYYHNFLFFNLPKQKQLAMIDDSFSKEVIQDLFPNSQVLEKLFKFLQDYKFDFTHNGYINMRNRALSVKIKYLDVQDQKHLKLESIITMIKNLVQFSRQIKLGRQKYDQDGKQEDIDQEQWAASRQKSLKMNQIQVKHYVNDLCLILLKMILNRQKDITFLGNIMSLLYLTKNVSLIDRHFEAIMRATEQSVKLQLQILQGYAQMNQLLGRFQLAKEALLHKLHLYEQQQRQQDVKKTFSKLACLPAQQFDDSSAQKMQNLSFGLSQEDLLIIEKHITQMTSIEVDA